MKYLTFSVLCLIALKLPVSGQPAPPAPAAASAPGDAPFAVIQPDRAQPREGRELFRVNFQGSPLDTLLQDYSQRTGKVILRDPRVANVNVTLVIREGVPESELLLAMESILAMNNIALVPFREQFIKVVPADSAVRAGIPLNLEGVEDLPEEDGVVSQLIQLRFLDFPEIQSLITERLSPNAKVQQIERTNSLLVTDSRNNIRRIMDIVTLIDQPQTVREELLIYPILYATASEIKSRLEELIAQSQTDLERQRQTAAGTRTQVRAPPGVIRPGGATTTPAPAAPQVQGSEPVSSPGLIRGRVQMVADDRTNILLIISRPENHVFFQDMISTLDKKVDPEITVRVYPLQFAAAEDVSSTLNDLIGAVTRDSSPASGGGSVAADGAEGRTGQTIRDFIQQRNAEREVVAAETASRTNIGEISPNTRILPDQRTNSLLLMGRNADLAVLEGVIRQLDRMLAQVLVRAVIMEVNLSDNFSYGIDWLQRSLTVNNLQNIDGVPVRSPVMSFGGGQRLSSGSPGFRDAATVDRNVELPAGNLSYFTTFYDFNLDMVLRFSEGRSDTKVIATPVILTTDNTEARIQVGERRAVPTTSATTIGGSVQTQIEFVNIGIDLSVTPRINPQGVVVMEIEQSTDDVGGSSVIDGNELPNINTRQFNASLAIPSGGTLVLGGLVREDEREVVSQVPLLGRIPFLGVLFRNQSTSTVRTELLVLISPEVILTPEEADALTQQLKGATKLGDQSWYRGWDAPLEMPETLK
jgi:general secretion pathway protein D